MIIKEDELREVLSCAFDAGFHSPLEMMDQEVDKLFAAVRAKMPSVASTENWTWGDYIQAIASPDPWVKVA